MKHHQLFTASIARKQVNALGKQILLKIVQQNISLDNCVASKELLESKLIWKKRFNF